MARCILTHEQRWIKVICEICKKEFERRRWQPETKYCSRRCYYDSKIGVKLPPFSKEHKESLSKAHTGKIISQETKDKMSESQKISSKSKAHRKKLHKKNCGEGNGRWIGGRRYDEQGYILIYTPDHPFATKGKCVPEHRLVMEQMIGRYLREEEQVHHINKIRDDNRPENLMLFANASEHTKHHLSLNKRI